MKKKQQETNTERWASVKAKKKSISAKKTHVINGTNKNWSWKSNNERWQLKKTITQNFEKHTRNRYNDRG